jgi:hypothetical protein
MAIATENLAKNAQILNTIALCNENFADETYARRQMLITLWMKAQ